MSARKNRCKYITRLSNWNYRCVYSNVYIIGVLLSLLILLISLMSTIISIIAVTYCYIWQILFFTAIPLTSHCYSRKIFHNFYFLYTLFGVFWIETWIIELIKSSHEKEDITRLLFGIIDEYNYQLFDSKYLYQNFIMLL